MAQRWGWAWSLAAATLRFAAATAVLNGITLAALVFFIVMIGVLRGLLLGLFAFAAFFVTLAELLVAQGIGIAFAAAILVAMAMQGVSLAAGRRLGLA